ncbi:MAG: thioredoxin family protein [Microscillaceae bacterium]|jgi:thiol-disulfide isomerase/thioredoxin|nr:thioredoxin family protein [Microscillaceae bacterium]
MKFKNIFLLPFTFLACNVWAQIEFQQGSWADIQAKAKAENKYIFVDAYTTWCAPCKWMAQNVFTDKGVGEFYNKNYVNFKLDMEKGEGLTFAKTYQVNAYPTLLYFNAMGEVVNKRVGGAPAEQFLEIGKNTLNPEKQISSLRQRYNKGERGQEFLRKYLQALQEAGEEAEYAKVTAEYVKLMDKKDWILPENWEIINATADNNSEIYQYILSNRAVFEEKLGKLEVNNYIIRAFSNEVNQVVNAQDEAKLQALSSKLRGVMTDNADNLVARLEMIFYTSSGNADKALNAIDNFLMKYSSDWSELNSIAWSYFTEIAQDDLKVLQKVAQWAKKSVSLNKNFANTDTYANILFKLGQNKEALKYAEESVSLGKAAGDDTTTTEELVKQIKATLK